MTVAPTGRILPVLSRQAPPPFVGRRGGKTPPRKCVGIDDDEMRRLFAEGCDDHALAEHFDYCVASIRQHRWALGLERKRGRSMGPRPSFATGRQSRHAQKPLAGKIARMPAYDHPALSEARTLYPATVVPVIGALNILVSGHNSWKIGAVIAKGRWKGFPVYTLTLEERATCPTSCRLWRSCFGNHMHMAKRIRHGADLECRLEIDVASLALRHPAGFAVRLHVLGFTAHIDPADPITRALYDLVVAHWPRAGLRFSNAPTPILSTVTIEHPLQKPADAIICPAQLGKTTSCGTCALCWSTERPIAFLRH